MPLDDAAPKLQIAFDNSYARLPDRFYARQRATPVAAPRLIKVNEPLADVLGIDAAALAAADGVAMLAGNLVADGSEPLAAAYAGHQFGGFSPQLGDGRALLLGEVVGRDGLRRDIQLKGSGPTPFSRRGDGRAAIGPVLREYVVSEAMAALGVPTTRALAAVTTGELVHRETSLPGAVLTRVAASHIRVGTFQYFAVRRDVDALRLLADHVIARHYPEAAYAKIPYLALLDGVIERQAKLIAQWMLIGFIHGVMNTDNCAVSGETIDYGPCAFTDTYHPDTVFSSIDVNGRYAYGNQPGIVLWNLSRFAETLLPLLADPPDAAIPEALARLETFSDTYNAAYISGARSKLGLVSVVDGDLALFEDLLARMAEGKADFTLTFRALCDGDGARARDQFANPETFDPWHAAWQLRLSSEATTTEQRGSMMRRANPAIIPRNHLVEQVIAAAVNADNFEPFHALNAALAAPYDEQPAGSPYTSPPKPDEIVRATFCGT
jgi:serine/tyrosine/threonine adenylyltransferase